MSTTKSCASNGGAGCSRGFVREKCHKCNLGSIACDVCHAGSLVTQHFHQLLQQHQQNQQQPNQKQQQTQRRGSKDSNKHGHQHHRLSSSSSNASSSSRSSSACSTPTTGSPRSSLSIEAASPIAGCGPLAMTTTTKMLQRTGSGSTPTGDTAPPPPSAVNSAPVPLSITSSSAEGPPPSLAPAQTPSLPLPTTIHHSQISSPSPRSMTIKTFSISYQLPLPSGHPQKSLVSSSPVSPIPAKDIALSVIADCPYPPYTRSAPSSPTANMTGPLFFATTRSSTTSSPPPFFPHPSLSISSSIPPSSPTTLTTIIPNSRSTPPLPSSSAYSVPSSPSPYGPSSLPCIFCFNGRKACEECFGLGYVQRICQECLRDRHRQQSRRRMKHTSLPNAWNQFGTKIKEQLFSHSSPTTAAAVSSNTATVPGTPVPAVVNTTATTTGTNGNTSSTSPPFSSSMLFPLQRRNTSANSRSGGITLPTATTVKTGIAGLSLKNKWQRQQRSKSMVSLPLATDPPSLSGHFSSPTTPTAVTPLSSSLVLSTALTGTASLSSASNVIIAQTGTTIIMTAGSGTETGLRPVDEGECEGTEPTGRRSLNGSSDATSEDWDNVDAGVDGTEGRGKKVVGHGEPSIISNNNNSQLAPKITVKKSFKATVLGALKLPNLFQGHHHNTATSATTPSDNNTNNNNGNNRSRRKARGDRGGASNRGNMDHVSNRLNNNSNNNNNNNNNNNGNQNASNGKSNSGGGGGRFLRGNVNGTKNSSNTRGRGGGVREGGGGSGDDDGGRGSRVPHRRQWSLSLPSWSMSSLPSELTVA